MWNMLKSRNVKYVKRNKNNLIFGWYWTDIFHLKCHQQFYALPEFTYRFSHTRKEVTERLPWVRWNLMWTEIIMPGFDYSLCKYHLISLSIPSWSMWSCWHRHHGVAVHGLWVSRFLQRGNPDYTATNLTGNS